MVISHNLSAMNAQRQFNRISFFKDKSTEKLSSGYKINRASDDAAGLAISEKMRWMIRGLHQGTENTEDGISFVQIGDGAMSEVHSMIDRIEELAVKGANGTLTDDDRAKIDAEVQQIKKQINCIARNTVFNELQIFDNQSFINVDGAPDDMSLFDASYDMATGAYSYGGFVFQGERVTWDNIDPDMIDTSTGTFTGGEYSYTSNGKTYNIKTEEGATVPEITRTMKVSASADGIVIDGETIEWKRVFNEDGLNANQVNNYAGGWNLDYHGASVSFWMDETVNSRADMINEVNRIMDEDQYVHYVWEEKYVKDVPKQAVGVKSVDDLRISSTLANLMAGDSNYEVTVKADETGIGLVDKDGNAVSGSDKTWAELGIDSWESGNYISKDKTYTYSFIENGENSISFSFRLADETSVDSVIDGLDGMKIRAGNVKNHYMTQVSEASDDLAYTLSASANLHISFKEELALGRNFDSKTAAVDSETIGYDGASQKASVGFNGSNVSDVITLSGSTGQAENLVRGKLESYYSFLEKAQKASMISGKPYSPLTIVDVVGAANITTSGYFSDTVTINSGMKKTDASGSWFPPGIDGHTYPTASIDFKDINSAEKLKSLAGTGFDSTCKTCTNHYSVSFVDTLTNPNKTTSQGYDYSVTNYGKHYLLEIDVNSLAAHGVSTGADLASAIVDIASESFDFHYTQYAADGSKLYIFDDREQSTEAPDAKFYTSPFLAENIVDFNMKLNDESADGGYVKLNYVYDMTELANASMSTTAIADGSGRYVKNSDLHQDPSMIGYSAYDSSMDGLGLQRYTIETKFYDADNNEVSKATAAISNTAKAMRQMLENTNISLDAIDYTYANMYGKEKTNICIAPEFESSVYKVGDEEGLFIVHSGIPNDKTWIPRFAMNTVAMNLNTASTKSIEDANRTIGLTSKAKDYVAMRRSTYGALQNRMEHTINNNQNKEENMTAAESRIRDTDMAKEMVAWSTANIIAQIGQNIMSQANKRGQEVLALLG